MLKRILKSLKLRGRKTIWLEALRNFWIFLIYLKPIKIHLIVDIWVKATLVPVNDLELLKIDPKNFIDCYESDQLYGLVLRGFKIM